nr:probable methionine--tRNA ligase [Tanacetum cinerariifolium]
MGGLQIKINNELISNLGNFISRVLCFIARDPGRDNEVAEKGERCKKSPHPSNKLLRSFSKPDGNTMPRRVSCLHGDHSQDLELSW